MTTSTLGLGRLSALAMAASAAIYGCSQTASPAATQAPAPGSESASVVEVVGQADGGASAPDGGRKEASSSGVDMASPKPLAVEVVVESGDGTKRQLSVDQPNLGLPADSRFELAMPRMADVRVRLFDESDRVVASNDKLEIGLKTRYLLMPAAPLVPGSKYTLVIDGLQAELPTDATGAVFGVVRVSLSTAGEKPPPPAPPKKKSSRKRNR